MITIGVHILLVLTYRFIPVSNQDLVPTSATVAAYISLLVVLVVIVIIYAKTIVFIAN